MITGVSDLLGMPEQQWVERCVADVTQALARRGLVLTDLPGLFQDQSSGFRHLLVTSSLAQGLSNATSDIDVIGITEGATPTVKMAVQKFIGRVHLEIIVFSTAEWAQARAEFEGIANLPLEASLAALRAWNRTAGISKKYMERIINGLHVGATMPYLDALPSLSRLWTNHSFALAHDCLVCALLAERAGESRGRIGYALNGVLYLMDAVLSRHGRVFSNKKWYLLRWRRFVQEACYPRRLETVASRMQTVLEHVGAACRSAGTGPALAEQIVPLYEDTRAALGMEGNAELQADSSGWQQQRFLPGARCCVNEAGDFILEHESEPHVAGISPAIAAFVDRETARSLLTRIRAGRLRIVWIN